MKRLLWAVAFLFALTSKAFANPCAVCTVAIGASLTLAREMGVDDCVVGVWAGAMLAIVGYWTIRFFDKRGWFFKGRDFILMTLSIAMIGFMYMTDLTYDPVVIGILYMDSFLFTSLLGAFVFIYAMKFYEWLKMKNGGHAHFPFEKVVIPFLAVFLTSLVIMYYPVCNCGTAKPGTMPVSADIIPSFD